MASQTTRRQFLQQATAGATAAAVVVGAGALPEIFGNSVETVHAAGAATTKNTVAVEKITPDALTALTAEEMKPTEKANVVVEPVAEDKPKKGWAAKFGEKVTKGTGAVGGALTNKGKQEDRDDLLTRIALAVVAEKGKDVTIYFYPDDDNSKTALIQAAIDRGQSRMIELGRDLREGHTFVLKPYPKGSELDIQKRKGAMFIGAQQAGADYPITVFSAGGPDAWKDKNPITPGIRRMTFANVEHPEQDNGFQAIFPAYTEALLKDGMNQGGEFVKGPKKSSGLLQTFDFLG